MIATFAAVLRRFHLRAGGFAIGFALLAAVCAAADVLVSLTSGAIAEAAESGAGFGGSLALLAAAGAASAFGSALCSLLRKRRQKATERAMRREYAAYLAKLPFKALGAKNSGEGASVFSADLPQAAEFVAEYPFTQLFQLIGLLVAAGFMLYMNRWLTLIYFALFPPLAWLQAKLSAPIGAKHLTASRKRAEFTAVTADALQNPLTLKAYGLEAVMERRFTESFDAHFKAKFSAGLTHSLLATVGVSAALAPQIVLAVGAAWLTMGGRLALAEFVAFNLVAAPVSGWLTMFSQELANIRIAQASARRLLDFAKPEETAEAAQPEPDKYAAVFEGVSFGYTPDRRVINGLSLNIGRGGLTALAGASGCGKSTVLKLLLGLYRPDEGRVAALRGKAYVPQDCYLLPVSIKDNIVGASPYDQAKLEAACENAGILSFINALPQGFDTRLSESAANVSGGQKQRIALARAFYADADLLVLDEFTGSLDPETERQVLAALAAYLKETGKTAVTVAHRQTVLDMADAVVTLAEGGAAVG